MALDAGSLVFVAYPKDDPLGTPAGTLTKAYRKSVTVEDNGIGHGSFAIHPDEAQAAWVTQDDYIAVWRDTVSGDPIAGFWVDTIGDVVLSPDEDGGMSHGVSGRGPIAILDEARVWPKAVSGASGQVRPAKGDWHWTDIHPAVALVRLLEEASARGCLPGVTWDFTRTLDSDGAAWTTDNAETYTVSIGTTLLDVVRELREMDLHITMTAGLVVRCWDSYDNDLSATIDLTGAIRDTSEIEAASRRGVSAVIVEGENKNDALRYRIRHDGTIETALGRRKEGFTRFTRTATTARLNRLGDRKLRKWKKQHDGPFTLGVIDTTNEVALVDYTVGDTVAVPTDYVAAGKERIAAITLTEIENGEYDPTLEFGDLATDPFTGATPSGDIEGAGCCGDTPGAGKKPGGGTGGGGPGGGTGGTSDPTQFYLDDFERDGYPVEVAKGTHESTGTTHDVTLPSGHDAEGAMTLLIYGHTTTSDSDEIGDQLATLGCTLESGPSGSTPGFVAGVATFTVEDGVSLADTIALPTAASETLHVRMVVISDFSGFHAEGASGDDPPSNDPNKLPTSTLTRWYTAVFSDAAVSGDPTGYANEASGDGGGIYWRTSSKTDDAVTEDPSAYTSAGTGERAFTIAVTAFGLLGRIPLQAETGAWWDGGNEWQTFFAGFVGDHGLESGAFYAESAATHETSGNNWIISLLGSNHPDDIYPALPMEVDAWEVEYRYKLSGAAGSLTDGGLRYAYTDWMFVGKVRLNFGDATNAEGIEAIGDATDTKAKSLTALGSWGRVKQLWRGGMVYGKEWAESASEPDWEVSAAAASPIDVTDVEFDLAGRLGNASGAVQRLDIDWIKVRAAVNSGSIYPRHLLANGDGSTVTFPTEVAYTPGTLTAWVGNQPVSVTATNGTTITFDSAPWGTSSVGARIEVSYEVA